MHQWLGWVLFFVGGLLILIEVVVYVVKTLKRADATIKAIPDSILIELIKKLPWMVVVGLILIYLGLYILGVPVPFSIAIGSPAN